MRANIKLVITWLLLTLVYYLAAKLGLSLAFENTHISPVWPPSGIAISALLYFGKRVWPSIFVGACLVNYLEGLPLLVATCIGIGNTLEALAAYYLIGRTTDNALFNQTTQVVKFVICILLACTISASLGVISLLVFNVIEWPSFASLWLTWWLGDTVGALIFTPLIITWLTLPKFEWSFGLIKDLMLVSVATLITSTLILGQSFAIGGGNYPLAFLYLPVVTWIAYRFHHHGATLFLFVVSGLSIYATLKGYGPFVMESVNESLLMLQVFMGVMMVTTLSLVSTIEEKHKVTLALMEKKKTLEQLVSQQRAELHNAEEELRLTGNAFDENAQAIVITNAKTFILRVNPAFSLLTGYSEEEVIGRQPKFLQSNLHDKAFYKVFWKTLLKEGCWQGEMWDKHKDGHTFPTWQTIKAVRDNHGDIVQFISVFSNISERKISEEKIYRLAHYDVVTGLRNRLAFQQILTQAISKAKRQDKRLAVLYLDLDNFKLINDTQGHPVGDLLLKHVADRICAELREEDSVARLGGDEFVILIEEIDSDFSVAQIAEKILFEINTPLILDHTEVVVTASIGVSIFPDNGSEVSDLLQNADVAMYRAKKEGRNAFQLFNSDMTAQAQAHLVLESELRTAIERNEFILNYQPQVDLISGEIIGCEALVRWMHPVRGVIMPSQFIRIAEQSGLIRHIGEWVLLTACQQQKTWQDLGVDSIPISVNLSAHQLLNLHLPDTVSHIIHKTGIEPSKLALEFTEMSVMKSIDNHIRIFKALHDIGVGLSIDDFGTGYSSMAYLTRLAIDKLKIDSSFIQNMTLETGYGAIVRASTMLGHNLSMKVVAEGVETLEQLQFLKDVGCDEMQGYFFCKALAAEEMTHFLRQGYNLYDLNFHRFGENDANKVPQT
jgi:diguanylate cyclase (GGDEF)-like protein/PAS domain S-box-containing protein